MKAVFKLITLQTGKGASIPASIAATSGTPQSANCGAAYAVPLVATVKNAAGVGLAGVSVTFTAPGSGASGTFASNGLAAETVVTNAAGQAMSSAFMANAINAAYNITATAGALSCNFALTNYNYQDLILSTFAGHITQYIPMNETTGTAIADVSGHGWGGTAANVALNALTGPGVDMGRAPSFNGTSSQIDIFSAALAAAFNKTAHTISIWVKVTNAAVWPALAYRMMFSYNAASLTAGCTNAYKDSSTNKQAIYQAYGGTVGGATTVVGNQKGWIHIAMVADGTTVTPYINKVAQTPITRGAWVNALTQATIGQNSNFWWKGFEAHLVTLDFAASQAQINILGTPLYPDFPLSYDAFCVAGQSNAMGFTTNPQLYTGIPTAYNYAKDYHLHSFVDPIDEVPVIADAVLDNVLASTGSIWPLVANSHATSRARSSIWIPSARDGTAIAAWAPGANHFDRTTLFGAMLYRAQQAHAGCVLWWQGESDALAGTPGATYLNAVNAIADTIYSELGIKLMVAKLQNCTGVDAGQLAAIQAAQVSSWANSHVLTGPDLSGLTTDDAYHLMSDANAAAAATLWWNAIAAAFSW